MLQSPSAAVSLAAPALLGAGNVKLGRSRDPWTYVANPALLGCYHGSIVPLLRKAPWTPGLNHNGPAEQLGPGPSVYCRPVGCLKELEQVGGVPIPHDTPVTAWGQKIDEPINGSSTYIVAHPTKWPHLFFHSEIWRRPRVFGPHMQWDVDHEGRLAFLIDCLRIVQDGEPLSDEQIDVAVSSMRIKASRLLGRDDHQATSTLDQIAMHLPRAHWPEAMLERYQAKTK